MDDDLATLADGDAVAIHAGFPNPALERLGQNSRALALDINRLLIRHPSSTYLFRIQGHEWEADGIFDGDIAVIDRAVQPRSADHVVAWQVSGFVVCRFEHVRRSDQFWGVITSIIHQYK